MPSPSEFEWDENKRQANVKKHGIDFVDAIEVFNDPAVYTSLSRHTTNEHRYVIVGSCKAH